MINRITIIGLGLIGGSFAKAFKKLGIKVSGFDLDITTLKDASCSNIFESVTDEVELINFDVDLIYICLPIAEALSFLDILAERKVKVKVTDACSTKLSLVTKASSLGLNFIGGHPIAGKECSGFINSDNSIFINAKHILTCGDSDLLKLHSDIGMNVNVMTADMHDEVFAKVSHLPHVVAFALMSTVLGDDALNYAGGGFKDFTRIAASDATMWANIFIDNEKEVIASIGKLEKNIAFWKDLVKEKNYDKLHHEIKKVSDLRKKVC